MESQQPQDKAGKIAPESGGKPPQKPEMAFTSNPPKTPAKANADMMPANQDGLSAEDQALLQDQSDMIPSSHAVHSLQDQSALPTTPKLASSDSESNLSTEDQALLQDQSSLSSAEPSLNTPPSNFDTTQPSSHTSISTPHISTDKILPSTIGLTLEQQIIQLREQWQAWTNEQAAIASAHIEQCIQESRQKLTEQWQDQLEHSKEHLRTRWRDEFQYAKEQLRHEWLDQQLSMKQNLSDLQTTITQIQARLSKIQIDYQYLEENWQSYQSQMMTGVKAYQEQISKLLQQHQEEFNNILQQAQQKLQQDIQQIQEQWQTQWKGISDKQQSIHAMQEQLQKRLGSYNEEAWQLWQQRMITLQTTVQREFTKLSNYLNQSQDEQINIDQQLKKRLEILDQQMQQCVELGKNFQHDLAQHQRHSVSQLQFWTTIVVLLAIYASFALVLWLRLL